MNIFSRFFKNKINKIHYSILSMPLISEKECLEWEGYNHEQVITLGQLCWCFMEKYLTWKGCSISFIYQEFGDVNIKWSGNFDAWGIPLSPFGTWMKVYLYNACNIVSICQPDIAWWWGCENIEIVGNVVKLTWHKRNVKMSQKQHSERSSWGFGVIGEVKHLKK